MASRPFGLAAFAFSIMNLLSCEKISWTTPKAGVLFRHAALKGGE
jgi:hypothetical protein